MRTYNEPKVSIDFQEYIDLKEKIVELENSTEKRMEQIHRAIITALMAYIPKIPNLSIENDILKLVMQSLNSKIENENDKIVSLDLEIDTEDDLMIVGAKLKGQSE